MKTIRFTLVFVMLFGTLSAQVGPYAPAAGSVGTTAIAADSSVFMHWASNCVLDRGWMNIADTTLGLASVGDESSCIGQAGLNGIASLGDQGSATLTFNGIIYNDEGPDFAIFENSFSDYFLELGIVEVSSDGENFYAFPSHSHTQSDSQITSFALLDPTNLYNLAGKYRALFGTPFDLEEMANISGLNIDAISHVRITDIVGSINSAYATYDSEANAINDPYPTEFASGGFDLDALGIIYWSPETAIDENLAISLAPYPNPFTIEITIRTEMPNQELMVFDSVGKEVWKGKSDNDASIVLSTQDWQPGLYFIHVINSFSYSLIKL